VSESGGAYEANILKGDAPSRPDFTIRDVLRFNRTAATSSHPEDFREQNASERVLDLVLNGLRRRD
jgi:hypothetical protein